MRAILFLIIFFVFYQATVAQQSRIDSLRALTKSSNADSVKIDAYLELAFLFRRGSFDSMYHYGAMAHVLSEKHHDKRREAKAKLAIGFSTIRLGKLTEGMALCKAALTIAEQHKFENIKADALNYIGLAYNYLGNYPTALEYYQKALAIANTINSKRLFAEVQNNIGGIYYNLKDYDNALFYWKRTLLIYQEINDQAAMGASLNNIGLAYADKGQYEKALPFYFRSLMKYETTLACGGVYAIENIGHAYLRLGRQDSAMFYLTKALRMAELCKSPVVQIGALTGMAEASNPNDALRYLEKAYEVGIKSELNRETAIVAKSLSVLCEKLGKTDRAFSFFKTYHSLQDSLYNSENSKAIGKLEAQYEFELIKNKQEALQRIEDLNKERKLTQEKWIRNTFIGGFVLMIFVAAFTYRNFRRKQLSNLRLRLLNKEIEEQKGILISQAEELKQLNETLSELNVGLEKKVADRTRQLIDKNTELENKNERLANYAFINAHKLRAPVATMLGLIMLFDNKDVDDKERNAIVAKIKLCSVELNDIVREIRQALEAGSV